jgi:GNAT superfamily N-acetyltransferase
MPVPVLENGFHDVPPGRLATVVTHLEMRVPAPLRQRPAPEGVTLEHVQAPDPDWYRDLFTRVGGHDWLWFSRLAMAGDELSGVITDPGVEIWALNLDGLAEGLLELDFRQNGACELAFFGVTRALIGTGAGRFAMNHAIVRAWARPIGLFHVHTCTLDHPAALGFYIRSGFVPVRQQVEIGDDPRLGGFLAKDAGPHVPVFE